MNILEFLFYLGIINIVFGFIWKWVFALPAAFLLVVLNFGYGVKIVKILGSYLFVSLTSLLTLAALSSRPSLFAIVSYSFLGAFVLFVSHTSNYYEYIKEARQKPDVRFEIGLIFGSVILYMIILFIPLLAINPITIWLFRAIDWIYNLPIIGWLIGIGGVIFILNISFYGLLTLGSVIESVINKFSKKEKLL